MDIYRYQVKGIHKTVYEDVICREKENDFLFCGMSGARTRNRNGKAGAQIALEVVKDYFLQEKISGIQDMKNRFTDELQYELMGEIRKKTNTAAKKLDRNITEFAASFCCIFCDLKTRDFVCAHLSDGRIAGLTKDDSFFTISMPEKGPLPNSRYYTMTEGAIAHTRFCFGELDRFKNIMLFSDGADFIFRNISRDRHLQEKLLEKNEEGIYSYIKKKTFVNNSGIIVISDF